MLSMLGLTDDIQIKIPVINCYYVSVKIPFDLQMSSKLSYFRVLKKASGIDLLEHIDECCWCKRNMPDIEDH